MIYHSLIGTDTMYALKTMVFIMELFLPMEDKIGFVQMIMFIVKIIARTIVIVQSQDVSMFIGQRDEVNTV